MDEEDDDEVKAHHEVSSAHGHTDLQTGETREGKASSRLILTEFMWHTI